MIRVALADDDAEVRAVLSELISLDPKLELVGVASDTVAALALAATARPDVMLMDVRIPPDGGASATGDALQASPQTRIVAYSAFDDRASVTDMLRAGAVAYVTKSAQADEVLTAIHRAMDGGSTLSSEVSAQVLKELGPHLRREKVEEDERAAAKESITRALEDPGVLTMAYQPIVDLSSGEVSGVEALARFGGTDRPPNVWFGEAWSVGLGPRLEVEAARRAMGALAGTRPDVSLAINLSPAAICAPEFDQAFRGTWTDRLVLEITEHARVEDYDALDEALADARRGGVRIAVDDAGSGYASLRHILRLEPALIKLDIELTRGIEADRRRRALARALISFASEIGAEIIAEGIETPAEVRVLTELGVGWGQGYLLGRPTPLPSLLEARPELRPPVPEAS